MSDSIEYRLRLHPRVARQISRWGLSDFLLVEVYLRLRELPGNPSTLLVRDPDSQGSLFVAESVDPDSPRFQHLFRFRVFFAIDEIHLDVVHASYFRRLLQP